MRVLALVALASILLAGCVEPETVANNLVAIGSGILSEELGGGAFHTGLAATEPTIGVDRKGAVFITALRPNPNLGSSPVIPFATFRESPTILRSLDDGLTWKDVFPALPTGDGLQLRTYDPYVYVDPDTGRVFMDDIFPVGCGVLSFSDDQGETWTTNPVACGNPQVNDHQTLVAAKPRVLPTVGYPKLVHRCVNNLLYAGCAVSLNGGVSFLPQTIVPTSTNGCIANPGHLEADAEGRVYMPLTCNAYPSFAVTEDDGRTWRFVTINKERKMTTQEHHDTDLAFDEAGNLYAVWPSDGIVYFASSADRGATWSPAHRVPAPHLTATMFGAIAAGSEGRVAIAYVASDVPGGYAGRPQETCTPAVSICDPPRSGWEGAIWHAYLTVAYDALAERPTFVTVQVSPRDDPLARGYCGGSRCNGMNDFLDVAVGPDGRPWAAFVDVCTAACVGDASMTHDRPVGMAGTLLVGPTLRGAGLLRPLTPEPSS